ncbi:MAG TPA: hypothetical protein VKR43_06595 [Bryobacteraceae bacterium]|nr:hypothetical protein [Bryobacteraceae bacterium]
MTPLVKGLTLAAVHVAMVLSLGGKLLLDRAAMPRVWVRTMPYDPNLPIRGRYVSLSIAAEARGFPAGAIYGSARLAVEDGILVARPDENGGNMVNTFGNNATATLSQPIAFFIPEHIPDPSRRPAGEELWVELTVPPKGPPRPIQLGVKKDGVLTPLALR